jgi:hypothetical protein
MQPPVANLLAPTPMEFCATPLWCSLRTVQDRLCCCTHPASQSLGRLGRAAKQKRLLDNVQQALSRRNIPDTHTTHSLPTDTTRTAQPPWAEILYDKFCSYRCIQYSHMDGFTDLRQ